MFVLVKARCD